jgi:hypothetical protein
MRCPEVRKRANESADDEHREDPAEKPLRDSKHRGSTKRRQITIANCQLGYRTEIEPAPEAAAVLRKL